jgi:hypothetical protein
MLAASSLAAVNATYSFSGGNCTQQQGVAATKLTTGLDGRGNDDDSVTVTVQCPVTGHESATIDEVALTVYYEDNNGQMSGGSIICFWARQDDAGGLTTSASKFSCDGAGGGCDPGSEVSDYTGRNFLSWGDIWSSATIYSYFVDCDLPPTDSDVVSWITGYEVEQTAR